MTESKYFLVQVLGTSRFLSCLTLSEVAYECGLHPELIERLVDLGLIDTVEGHAEGEVLFHWDVVPQLRRIVRLRNHLGVNYAGIGVILELMARIESLETHIHELESRFVG
jgi:DNA-binding transcriptional MerR regulator